MANWDNLKAAIQDVIKENGNEEITGQVLQNTLLSIIRTIGANATFAGIATPETNPGTPDQNVFWIAINEGNYINFGNFFVENGITLITNKNGTWDFFVLITLDKKLSLSSNNPLINKVIYENFILKKEKKELTWENGYAYNKNLSPSSSPRFEAAILSCQGVETLEIDVLLDSVNAYVSVVDVDNNILFQTNNINKPIYLDIKNQYPDAYKVYVSNMNTYDGSVTTIDTVKEKVVGLSKEVEDVSKKIDSIKKEIQVSWIDGVFYNRQLISGSSPSYERCFFSIDDNTKKIELNINLPSSGAYVLLADNNNEILWSTNNIIAPYIIDLSLYPDAKKIYISNNKINNPNPKIYKVDDVDNIINNLDSIVTKMYSKTISGFNTRMWDINYNSEKNITIPNKFNPFPIDINISRDGNIFGCDINPFFLKKNNNGIRTYYIAPNGDDNNNGLTYNSPFKNINTALQKEDCNTIILLDGEYIVNVNFPEKMDIDKEINIIGLGDVVINSLDRYSFNITKGCYIENLVFTGGSSAINTTLKDDLCVFVECEFNNSINSNGLTALGGHYILYKCVANNNYLDGFNYHSYQDDVMRRYYPFAVEINCIGSYNGIRSNLDINNCSSMHELGKIIRINCQYSVTKGGIVAEADSGKSLNFGIISSSTTTEAENRKGNFVAINGAEMWLYNCVSFGSEYDIIADNADVYRDNVYPKEKKVNGGIINDIS